MAVKVKDTTSTVRILPEVSEVGKRIDLKVGNESSRAQGIEQGLRTDVDSANSLASLAKSTADTAQSSATQASSKADLAGTKATEATSKASEADTKASNAQTRVMAVEEKIPSQASSTNQLADKEFVNSSVAQNAANRVTYNEQGDPFPSRATLMGASTFYFNGEPYTPDDHDYALVVSDEGAPSPFTGGQTRFEWSGSAWVYAYGINDKPFTSAERQAIESGITSEKVEKIGTLETSVSSLQDTVADLQEQSNKFEYYVLSEEDWTSGS